MPENQFSFYGGKADEKFLSENSIFYCREIEDKACLFAEKNVENIKIFLLDYTMGLFLLNEKELRLWLNVRKISLKSLDVLLWKDLQILRRSSQIVVLNYFRQYGDLLDNFPELNEYEAVIREAENYKKQAPVSNLTQKYFWQFVETTFIFGLNATYSEEGVRLVFGKDKKIIARRAKKQLKILQENKFLRFKEAGTQSFDIKFNRQTLHINFLIAPQFFRFLVFDDTLYVIQNTEKSYSEPDEKYQPKKLQQTTFRKRRKKSQNVDKIVTEAQFLQQYQNQVELGKISEKRVIDLEIKSLSAAGKPDLAEKIRSVADRPGYGFDIISYETDGTEKQIEVKTIQTQEASQSFIITRNELEKSKKLPNYYLYCVKNPYSEDAEISFFRQPDFQDTMIFEVEPLSFEVRFRTE